MTAMRIKTGCVVTLNFSVWGEDGELLDDAWTVREYGYIQGFHQMPRGFEANLEELVASAIFEFEVLCADAYGARNNQLVQKVDASQFSAEVVPGMVIQMEVAGEAGAPPLLFHVKSVREGVVHLDGNHPFAGRDLRFEGEVLGVREASEEELLTGRLKRPSRSSARG